MKPTHPTITDTDLHRFIDGELSDERAEQVADYLEHNPQAAQRVAQYQQLNDGLRLAHDDILHSDKVEKLPAGKSTFVIPPKQFAIAASWLAIGVTIGWAIQFTPTGRQPDMGTPGETSLQQQLAHPAMLSYATYTPEVLHPVEVDAKQQQHLTAWLTKRLGKSVTVPDLSTTGYSLLGGRLLPGDEKPAAMFMYENQSGQRITLNITRSPDETSVTAFQFAQEAKIRTFYWVDNGFGYALSGEIDKPPLLNVANVVYHQLNL